MTKSGAPRNNWALFLMALVAGGCAGDGCGGCLGVTPGGFPHEQRIEQAAQLRLAASAIETLEADPAALVASFLSSGESIEFEIPPQCGDPAVCCDNGTPSATCGPITIDLVAQPGDPPRLTVDPIQGQSRVDITVRARIATASDLPIEYSGFNCDIS
ncbi:MAG TPA: hypothetical protein VKZ63_22295, partial [Kofleriaceae bacterium]|nr:hypothetical protein [Kofleriaceae bacterium]